MSGNGLDRTQIIGLVIVLIGVVLLIDELELLSISLTGSLFGLVVLLVGVAMLVSRYQRRRLDRVFLPALLVLFGGLLVADEFTSFDAMDYFFPLLVILIGVAYISRPWRRANSM